jgi:polyferredoxin
VIVDGLTGATITSMVVNSSVMQSAREVAQRQGLLVPIGGAVARGAPLPRPEPLWPRVWRERWPDVAITALALAVLLTILLFQDWLARHPTLLTRLRTGYLLFTLGFIGWYGLAQLSIVNVFTFTTALASGFQWESFLLDPLMFMLWTFVAFTVLLWGRGVYCGWLCPFGALQELAFRLARWLRLPSWEPPEMVHERLAALKYLILIALFGLSLHSLTLAERASEVEPFKTVVTLRFLREWPYVAYAGAVLLLGLLVRKLFCRYLCPLGAALTFPARFRIFDWLRRRRECGRPCHTCAVECEIRAIGPTGKINELECHYCLDCQVTYWNDHKCPPLVERRRKEERRLHAKLALQQRLYQAPSDTERGPAVD